MCGKFEVGELVYYFDPKQEEITKGYFLREITSAESKYLRDRVAYQLANLDGEPVCVVDIYREDQLDMPDEAFEQVLADFLKHQRVIDLVTIKMNKYSDAQIGRLLKEIMRDGDLKRKLLEQVLNLIEDHQLYYKK